MKRGKNEEKVMEPMFPRLHVNDTEKGGPRGPPRNKMALYEQLSIPSQRFKPGVPISPDNTTNGIPPTSSSQGSAEQRAVLFSLQLPSSRQSAEKADNRYSDSNVPLVQLEQKKKSEEDDFRVPVFMQPSMVQDSGRNCYGIDEEKSFLSTQASIPHSMKHLPNTDTVLRQMPIGGHNVRLEDRSYQNDKKRKNLTAARKQLMKAVSDSSSIIPTEVSIRKNDTCSSHEPVDSSVNNCSRVERTDNSLQPGNRADWHRTCNISGDAILNGPKWGKNNGDPSVLTWDNHSEEQGILDDMESPENETCGSLPTGIADRNDDTSETSMVDCISGLDVSPDDVVGIIGQKHFWKARRAIVNQQRVFAVQVFELHRLIKVQKLIAGSPHLLLENNSYLGKPTKGSSMKKIPLGYIVKGPPNNVKLKNESGKPNHKVECSAENTVGKESISSVQHGSQQTSHKPFLANSPITTVDQTSGSWCFHHPQGNQWLVPVMSPSEGLVYKPYPGPGFMGPVCGGCGPIGAVPMMGNFLSPAYGVPASHHYQGMGVLPFAASAGPHGYFPPYGMPALNQANSGSAVDQTSQFGAPGFHGQSPGMGTNTNIQHQNSSTVPAQKNGANGVASDAMKFHASQDIELQVSTASSPSERTQGTRRGNGIGASNVLTLFPTSSVGDVPNNTTQTQNTDQPAQVIKVVPHNGRSATKSAARIFQSIQQERQKHDSV